MKRRTEKRKAGDELRRKYDLSKLKGLFVVSMGHVTNVARTLSSCHRT
jgi:hypothetical protein